MTSQVGINFNIKLGGDDIAARFRAISASMAGVHAATKKVGESWQGIKDGFQGLAVAGAALVGAGFGLFSFAKSATDAADDVGDLAARYGVASEAIQVYGDLVKDAGGSTEDAAAAFRFLNKSMHGAIYGNEKLRNAFAGVGISVDELKGMKPEQVMERVADAFQGSNNELAKQAVLTALMGKNGTVMMGVMNGGAQAIRDHYAQMGADGRLFTQEQLENADKFAKQWQRTEGLFEGMKNALGLELMGVLQPVILQFHNWALANKEVIATGFRDFILHLPPLFKSLVDVARVVGTVFSAIAEPVKAVAHTFGMTAVIWGGLAVAAGPLIASVFSVVAGIFGLMKAAFLLVAPLGMVGVAIGALGIAAFMVWKNWDEMVGGAKLLWQDFTDWLGKKFDAIAEKFRWLADKAAPFTALMSKAAGFTPLGGLFSLGKSAYNAYAGGGGGAGSSGGGGVPALLANKQQVGGEIRVKIEGDGRPKVTEMKSTGGIDLFADTGVMGAAM